MKEIIHKITESEFEVMKALWSSKEALTFTEIREDVQKKMGWSQSTVKTLLNRLHKKGAIAREEGDVYYYTPLISEDEYNDYVTQSIIDKLYNGNAMNLIATLVKSDKLGDDDMDELLALLHEEDGKNG